MTSVRVTHATGEYTVHVEPGALGRLGELLGRGLGHRHLGYISDDTVAALRAQWNLQLPQDGLFTFPAGEASKTRKTWSRLSDALLAAGYDRQSAIVALGGGVVGDLAGFVAATFLRGIPYAQVPTTLLAMLDASVGGKVGVDTALGKNLIGAFHPPAVVIADPLTLLTLPDRVYRAGLAEAVKHGVIADAEYFAWIERSAGRLLARDLEALTHLVTRSVEIKAGVVSEDEREGGRRAILNAGHTIAHGLEQESAYQLPHGEAVGLGLIAECRIAERMGLVADGLSERVRVLLATLGLPTRVATPPAMARVLEAMLHDKKNRDGAIRLALPVALGRMHEGQGKYTVPVTQDLLASAVSGLAS
ncbi:MAG TPA: 3-dehydroquinate synthase [Gemmatimonadales bacterium]|nr:3-dehydroquinate synthase [Gemmatimonadales bacterium]